MGKRVVMVLTFVVALFASFSIGYMINPTIEPAVNIDNMDETFTEVMNELMENHYKQPSRDLLIEGAIEGMITILDDPFTTYFDAEEAQSYISGFGESYVGIGVLAEFIEGRIVIKSVVNGGPADFAGIRPNDIISSVDGISTEGAPFYETIGKILGEENTEVTIGVIRAGVEDEIILSMTRASIDNPTVTYEMFERSGQSIGYIKVNTFGSETAQLFHEAIVDLEQTGMDSLIIDLRVNGGGFLSAVTSMLREFLIDDGNPMFSIESYHNGEFSRQEFMATLTEKKSYNIVTLVNENSASASEVFSSAMQEQGGYTVIGMTTYGKGTMQTEYSISASLGDSLHITIGKWFTSDDNWVHYDGGTDGVTPDIEVDISVYERAYKVFLLNGEELQFDTVDSRVANIQVILNTMGYLVRMDGYYDQATQAAVIAIQSANGLPTTGNIDSDTASIINDAIQNYLADKQNDLQLETTIEYLLLHPTND
ncbi:MAG: S41 family peptidase [Bacilli bacterium]|nr:S41 family peptidase [Bacilli bacterium]